MLVSRFTQRFCRLALTSSSSITSCCQEVGNVNKSYSSIYYYSLQIKRRYHSEECNNKIISANNNYHSSSEEQQVITAEPGSKAFSENEKCAITDLFHTFAKRSDDLAGGMDEIGDYLCIDGVRELLSSIGESPSEQILIEMFKRLDQNQDGKLHLDEFLTAADQVLAGAPARIILVVGGPGSGKGLLCDRLAAECGAVHLSCGDMLREEVAQGTVLGKEVDQIMKRGELVSSAVITTLVRRRMRDFPGKRVLLDGFPRTSENAKDFAALCGIPELALHLTCDDTILLERIIKRSKQQSSPNNRRADDNIDTALTRLRTYHKYHTPTMQWLQENHIPIVNLDCSGTPENVWNQLLAIGRLMRPVAK